MYTVIVYGIIECWEKSFPNYYDAFSYYNKVTEKGLHAEMVECYY